MGAEGAQHLAGLRPLDNKVSAAHDKQIHLTPLKWKMMHSKSVEIREELSPVCSVVMGAQEEDYIRNSCYCNYHWPITVLKTCQ